jgi:predicted nucleotide-binding protein
VEHELSPEPPTELLRVPEPSPEPPTEALRVPEPSPEPPRVDHELDRQELDGGPDGGPATEEVFIAELAPEPPRGGELVAGESLLAREPSRGGELAPERAGASLLAREDANGVASKASSETAAEPRSEHLGKRVFLVHGMNEKWKHAVVRLLERTGPHEVTILHERPSEGRTLIEQAAGTGYAVVLLTADEVGTPRLDSGQEPWYSPRPRQSVVFEMGLLVGVLTPRYVCVLYERGVDLPSEVYGLAYVLLDTAGTWQSKLLMQLRSAGFDYQLE